MGALIPLAISLAPELAKWLFGPKAATTAQAVSQAIEAVTGTADQAAQTRVVAQDPQAAAELRVRLAQLASESEKSAREEELRTLQAALADTQSARAQTVALAQARSVVAYGAPIVSCVVLTTFGVVMTVALTRSMPSGSETILNMLLGSLAAMATSVVSYWVGSSAGSARKDERLASLASSSAKSD